MWLVDFNRQSLDRVVPGVRIAQWRGQFEAAGWHVVEVKYGRRLRDAPPAVRGWIDLMSNEQYQALFGQTGPKLREMFLDGAPAEVGEAVAGLSHDELASLVQDLGGHDLVAMLEAYAQCDAVTDRPSVVFAYTVKGYGLPIAGNPRNHSALLTAEQIGALRESMGAEPRTGSASTRPPRPASSATSGASRCAGRRRARPSASRSPRPRAYAPRGRCPPRTPSARSSWSCHGTRRSRRTS